MSDDLSGREFLQVALSTADLPRAVAFYRDTLGLPFLFEVSGMAFFQVGSVRLMVGDAGRDFKAATGSVLYFNAPDLPALAQALEARGVAFLRPAETLQQTDAGDLMLRPFRDPDGNHLALMGVVPRA
ncbi:MAG TPA: VOC family protein [Caulobacteraceae bacterium]|jgi:methylmalonyl-CoA/ethylmalonyl-CoA epimerase|nr:VOC family protein [Caulobacteraceae bacterium]